MAFLASLKKKVFILENFCWNTLLTDILDWHCIKSSNDSLYFYGDLYRHFYVLRSSDKKQERQCIELKFDLFFELWLEIFYSEESSILSIIQPSGVVLRGVIEP